MILIIFGSAAQFILLLAIMRLATDYLQPHEMGRLSLITATTAFYALFLVNPVGMFINRRLHAWDSLGRVRYYLKLHWLYLLGVCVIAAFSLAILNQWHIKDIEINTLWLLALVCGALLFNTINQTVIPSLNLLGFRARYVALTLSTLFSGLLCAVFLVDFYPPSAEHWLLGLLMGQTLFALVGIKVFFGILQPTAPCAQPTKRHLHALFHFAWPVALAVAFNWLQTQGYRFFVTDSIGLAGLGLFVTGYGISAGLIAAFELVLTTYFQPRFYKNVSTTGEHEQSQVWSHYAGAILPTLVLVMFVLIGLAPELTLLLVGPAYQSASQYLVWGVLAEGARVAAGVYSMSAHAKMNTRALIAPNFLGAITCIGLIVVLVPLYGAHGVGFARALSGFFLVATMHIGMLSTGNAKLPGAALLKAALGGAAVWMFVMAGRWGLGGSQTLATALALIGLSGAVFLFMFYSFVKPYLSMKEPAL